MGRISVTIDEEHRQRLGALAAERQVDPDVIAGEMLTEALDRLDADGARYTEILDSIPGSWERAQEAMKQAERGETIPLSDLP
jgi:hypothetical protein